jgi:ComF family protein
MVNNWLNNIHYKLLPAACVLCGANAEPGGRLCFACLTDLPFISTAVCTICAMPLVHQDSVCGNCLKQRPFYTKCRATFHYSEPVAHLIQALKFHRKLAYAALLGGVMADALEDQLEERPQLIIPVPLNRIRLRERGFNQALELARPIARKLAIPLDFKHSHRKRPTSVQSLLPADERRHNVRGAFEFNHPGRIKSVAIVDDVMTTTHTVNEFARTLVAAGVDDVQVWVCARAAPAPVMPLNQAGS